MPKKSVKGGVGSYCGIECTDRTTGRVEKYDNRSDCPTWWNSHKKTGKCTKQTNCGPTMEPAERCITSYGDILHADKSACVDDTNQYWGKVCVQQHSLKPTGNFRYRGGKYKKKQTKKSKKHMKKQKKIEENKIIIIICNNYYSSSSLSSNSKSASPPNICIAGFLDFSTFLSIFSNINLPITHI